MPEMEDRIRNLDGIEDVALTVLEGEKGPYLGAVIVASDAGFHSHDAKSVLEVRRRLTPLFPKGTVPKRYRFVTELPRNPQGKVTTTELRELLV